MEVTTSKKVINEPNVLYPGIRCSTPKHPEHALFSARQISFYNWYPDNKTDPTTLSKAGFFFTGIQDCVKCFFCGGGLKNWQSGDNPWIEHARWFPKCDYLILCMGESFINTYWVNHTGFVEVRKGMLNQAHIPDDWMIRELNSDVSQTFLSCGYSQADVENGILHVRQKYGKTGYRSELILKYLKDLDENRLLNNIRFHLSQEIESTDYLRNSIGNTSSSPFSSLNGEFPIPNLVFRGSNYQLPETTIKLAIDEIKREKEERLLREENRKLRESAVCKVCLDLQATIVFLPCGHFVSCSNCADRLSTCAICRTVIRQKVLVQ